MALRYYRHNQTGEIRRSLRALGENWVEVVAAPNQKFMVAANRATGTSKMKDSTRILTERARNHSREHDLDNNIQLNRANGLGAQVKVSFLNSKGERRRKIDDI